MASGVVSLSGQKIENKNEPENIKRLIACYLSYQFYYYPQLIAVRMMNCHKAIGVMRHS
jgi:hypothetical protein